MALYFECRINKNALFLLILPTGEDQRNMTKLISSRFHVSDTDIRDQHINLH